MFFLLDVRQKGVHKKYVTVYKLMNLSFNALPEVYLKKSSVHYSSDP